MRQAEPRAVNPGIVFLPPGRCPKQVNFLEMVKQVTGKGSGNIELPPQTLLRREIQGRGRCLGRWGVQRERQPLQPNHSLLVPPLSSALMWHYYFLKTLKYYFYPSTFFSLFLPKGTKESQPTCSSNWQP